MLDISAAYLSQLEKGKRDNPSEALVEKAAQVLGIPLSQLISETKAEQAVGLPPREETRPRLESAASAPSAVKSAGKKGQAEELRAALERLQSAIADVINLMEKPK